MTSSSLVDRSGEDEVDDEHEEEKREEMLRKMKREKVLAEVGLTCL